MPKSKFIPVFPLFVESSIESLHSAASAAADDDDANKKDSTSFICSFLVKKGNLRLIFR